MINLSYKNQYQFVTLLNKVTYIKMPVSVLIIVDLPASLER
jgi:hypothetical protein